MNTPSTHRPAPRRASLSRALAAALLSGIAFTLPAAANSIVGATPEDVALATGVQAALLKDKAFQATNVDIAVRAWQGKVNLSGWIGEAGDDALARKIASSVSGVKMVSTNLRSWSSDTDERAGAAAPMTMMNKPPSIVGATAADVALATSVQSALAKDRAFQAADVDIVVRAAMGRVNLSGWVSDVKDDALARKIAASVGGVKMVSSNLRSWSSDEDRTGVANTPVAMSRQASIVGASQADMALATSVRAAVMQAPAFQDPDVDVVVRAAQGRVNLSGWVSYANNDIQARKLAAAVPGVKSVTSDFKSWSSETDPRP